jgi:acyl transferase domain-containing protein
MPPNTIQTSRSRTGVYVGMVPPSSQSSAHRSPGMLVNMISELFSFGGPSIAVDTLSASSMTAIHMACTGLRNGECDVAVAGGVFLLDPEHYIAGCQRKVVGSHKDSRSFSVNRDGVLFAEGVGAVLLKDRC